MRVHAAAVVAKERFGHEGGRLAMFARHVLHYVTIDHHGVGTAHERVKAIVNFRLAGRGDFMVLPLDFHAELLHQ